MAYQAVAKTVRVEMRQRLDEEPIENVYHIRHADAAWTEDQIAILALAMKTWWLESMAIHLSTALTLVEVFVQDLTGEFGLQYSYTSGLPAAGVVSGECSTNQTAACLALTTGTAGRGGRGRSYIAGIPEGFVTQNLLLSGFRDGIVTAYNSLSGMLAALDDVSEHVIVSRKLHGVLRPTGLARPVTGRLFRSPYVRSQRGREKD